MKCDFCDLAAIANFQKIWTKFTIDNNGEYRKDKNFRGSDLEEPVGEDNIHLCKKHLDKWLKGKI